MVPDVSRRALLTMALAGTVTRASPAGGPGGGPEPMGDEVRLRDHGADPTGRRSAVDAFNSALAAGRRVVGTPGDIYLLDRTVAVPPGREIVGQGATLRLASGAIGLRLDTDGCTVSGWTIRSEDGLYAVLNTGRRNRFSDNTCSGNIGHYFFSTGADHVSATGNRIIGMGADREITTAIVVEDCRDVTVARNRFEQIPVGWGVQVRNGSRRFTIADNSFAQTRWTDRVRAQAGQTVFTFTLGSVCLLKKVQVDGLPLSLGYTITGEGPSYTVTFRQGRAAGETIALVGYRGAENIQIATGSRDGVITGNTIDGTGDSGIICFAPGLTVRGNVVRNCGYAGIAIYGGQDHIVVADNIIADCAQMDDGLSSPDDPRLASAFAGAILASGEDATVTGNTIINDAGTMRYGVRINKSDMALRTDGRTTIAIAGNVFRGRFADGRVFAPNETSGARINSIAVDGASVAYPGRIELDRPWRNAPGGANIVSSGFGRVGAIRDAEVRLEGQASLRTVAGEYVDFALSEAAVFRNCNVTVSFWARAAEGRSYLSVFTVLDGLPFPLMAEIIERRWRRYVISFPLTPKLADTILIRCGAISGSANIERIAIEGRRL